MIADRTIKRFWSKVDVKEDNAVCWQWLGSVVNETGRISTLAKHGLSAMAHYAAYQLSIGEMPSDHKVVQTCGNLLCCNPAHLALQRNPTVDERFEAKVDRSGDCHLWTAGVDTDGYGVFAIAHHNEMKAHRYAWEKVNGKIPEKQMILHRCDRTGCVNPDHLFVGTGADNMADMVKKSRQSKGENQHKAKLTEKDVIEIRLLVRLGHSQVSVAKTYGVTAANVNEIILRKTWKHI